MISIAEYARVLRDWPLPTGLIATKSSTASKLWREGDGRRLEHQCWRIATSDAQLKRLNVYSTVSFDSAIGFPSVSLAAKIHRGDNLAKKLLVLRCLTTGLDGGGRNNAADIVTTTWYFDWIVRYRNAKGLTKFSQMTVDDFHEYCSVLSTGELLSLLPYEEFLNEMMEGAGIDDYLSPAGIHWARLADALGVTSASINQSSSFADALISTFPDVFVHQPKLLLDLRRGTRQSGTKFDPGDGIHAGEVDATDSAKDDTGQPKRRKKFQHILGIWGYLHFNAISRPDEDGLSFNPFELESKKQLEHRYGDLSPGRTRTLEPVDLFRILGACTTWIYRYGDYIATAYNGFQEASPLTRNARRAMELGWERNRPDGAPKLAAGMNLGSLPQLEKGQILLGVAVRHLLSAIAVLILTFGARRSIEVNSIKLGCLHEDRPGLLELEVYIAKTHQNLGRRPVPEILRKAVSLLDLLSARTREKTGDDWLFAVAQYPSNPNRQVSTRFDFTINDFVTFAGLEPPDGQEVWRLTSHMFRRGFGIYYYHGFDGANLDALSLMYWHYDPRMTRVYINMAIPGQMNRIREEIKRAQQSARANRTPEMKKWIEAARKDLKQLSEFAKDFDEARCEFFVSKMIDVWMRKDSVAGRGGRALFNSVQAIAAQVASAVRIGSRANSADLAIDDIREEFRKFATTNLLEPVIGTNVFCTANPTDEKVKLEANCLNLKNRIQRPQSYASEASSNMPDFDFALNSVCADCAYCAIFARGRAAIEEELRDEKARIPLAATAEVKHAAQRRYEEKRLAYATALKAMRSQNEG
ncbi:hypothetical protein FHT77_001798 [Rhizobium sp. BK181]|uniref:hypothetical protein n=1 Tax=Rhizobium sp. BK181 TaxID=2587072 RepID=UPI0016189899|nr:hypothetical protein [Rhizobium sp. BK181]MBB3315933.1 hypothetical protein [Rhizobium sp. BK181]